MIVAATMNMASPDSRFVCRALPRFTSGYATMTLLALVPPLWRYIMDPRVIEHRKTQPGQVWRHGPTPKAL